VRVGGVRPAERVGDDAGTQVRDPEVVLVDPRRVAVGEELVGHVPLPDLAAEVRDLVGDVLVRRRAELGGADAAGSRATVPGS
jgi:hypothetical protein